MARPSEATRKAAIDKIFAEHMAGSYHMVGSYARRVAAGGQTPPGAASYDDVPILTLETRDQPTLHNEEK